MLLTRLKCGNARRFQRFIVNACDRAPRREKLPTKIDAIHRTHRTLWYNRERARSEVRRETATVARNSGSDVTRGAIWRTLDNVNSTTTTAARMWVSISSDFSSFSRTRRNAGEASLGAARSCAVSEIASPPRAPRTWTSCARATARRAVSMPLRPLDTARAVFSPESQLDSLVPVKFLFPACERSTRTRKFANHGDERRNEKEDEWEWVSEREEK